MKKIILLWGLSLLPSGLLGGTAPSTPGTEILDDPLVYVRPFPDLPKLIDPSVVNDLFSYSVVPQIHATLFRLRDNIPAPYLVSSFEVSHNSQTYRFRLKEAKFHDGTPLTANHIKASFENAIRNRATNFEGFKAINGFENYLRKTSTHITGISHGRDELEVVIELKEADSEFLAKLTDIRFSIWKVDSHPEIGLGPYRVLKMGKGSIELLRFPQPALDLPESGPRKVLLVQRNLSQAISGYRNQDLHDLFFYSVSFTERNQFSAFSHQRSVFFPRTYALVLNSRRLRDVTSRRQILQSFDATKLAKACFPEEKTTKSLIPPGYLGHDESLVADSPPLSILPPRVETLPTSRLNFIIIDSIGSELCAKKEIERQFKGQRRVRVRIESLSDWVKHWSASDIDGALIYIEGETTLHYFGAFQPNSEFSFGDVDDEAFDDFFHQFDMNKDLNRKHESAKSLSLHILSRNVIKPLFHQKPILIYNKRFRDIGTQFTSAALLPLTVFNPENRDE